MTARGKIAATEARGALTNPEFLQPPPGVPDEYAALWESIVSDYPADFFREGHRVTLNAYLQTILRLREVDAILAMEGLVRPDQHGGEVSHPLLPVSMALNKQIQAYARSLRLTPLSERTSSPSAASSPVKAQAGAGRRARKAAEQGVRMN